MNKIIHRKIKMRPVGVKSGNFVEYNVNSNDNDPKFKIGNYVRISKYKTIFAWYYTPNWTEEIFVIKKVKNIVPWRYVVNDLNGEKFIGIFYHFIKKTAKNKKGRI